MLKLAFFLGTQFLLIGGSFALYGRVPGEPYLGFLKKLTEEQRSEVQSIIFDPKLTKAEARWAVIYWAHETSPLTMESLDSELLNYEDLERGNERILDRRAQNFSRSGRKIDAEIRSIYENDKLTEREACDAAKVAMGRTRPEVLREVGVETLECDEIFRGLLRNK